MQCIHVSHAFSNVGIKKLKEKKPSGTKQCTQSFKLGLLMKRFWGDAVLSQEGLDSCIRRCLIASLTNTH